MGELTENVTLLCPNYTKVLCDGILHYFNSKQWTDMVLIGDDGFKIELHRLIFACFSNKFTSTLTESEGKCMLDGLKIDQDDVSAILEFAYKGEINLDRKRLDKLKEGAEILGFQLLIDEINSKKVQEIAKPCNKRKAKPPVTRSSSQPSTSGLSLRKKPPINYLENISDDESNGDVFDLSSELPLFENAILIELEDDDEDDDDDDDESDLNFNSDFVKSLQNKRPRKTKSLADAEVVDKSNLECVNCDFISNDWESLRKHYQTNHSKHSSFTYTCTDCDFVCDKKLTLSRHIFKEHSHDRPFQCDKCDYRGKTMSSLRSHAEMHSEDKFTCTICDQKFTLSCSLNRHMKLHLSNEKTNVCHLCPAKYRRTWDLKVHLRQVHNVEVPAATKSFQGSKESRKFQCTMCDYEGWEQMRYINHLAVRHKVDPQGNKLEPKYKCEHCDFECFVKSQLTSHIDRVHSEKTFSCNECDYTSPRKADLTQHTLRKHSDQKHFMCETCGFLCATQRYLARHQETHQGNQLVCGVCDMKFTLKSSLKRHGKLHISDEKPHSCHLCSYSARKRYNLKCHLKRIHKVDIMPAKETVEPLVYQEL
ncbi:hypothetical protein CHUAL_003643 [Chamberlinius hualienensis]